MIIIIVISKRILKLIVDVSESSYLQWLELHYSNFDYLYLEGVVVRSFCMPIHAVLQRKCLCTAWIRTPITNKMEYTVLQNVQVKAKQTQKLQLQQNKLFKTVNLKHFFKKYTPLWCEHVCVHVFKYIKYKHCL